MYLQETSLSKATQFIRNTTKFLSPDTSSPFDSVDSTRAICLGKACLSPVVLLSKIAADVASEVLSASGLVVGLTGTVLSLGQWHGGRELTIECVGNLVKNPVDILVGTIQTASCIVLNILGFLIHPEIGVFTNNFDHDDYRRSLEVLIRFPGYQLSQISVRPA